MTLSSLWLFIVMTFVVSATPGPNMLLIMRTSARYGVRAAVMAMAGCMTALLAMMTMSAAGLGALLQSFPSVFDALRWAGAAYLAYLGVKCWRDRSEAAELPNADASVPNSVPVVNGKAIYRQAFLVAASNPKAILFAAAFFPQFINPEAPGLMQFAILLVSFTVIEVGWYFVYALGGKRLSVYLRRATVLRAFNRVTGGAFVGFAALMATTRG